jgi:hypothetical protein
MKLNFEAGVQTQEDPEWFGPDPLLEMAAKARVVCRKGRGHDKHLLELLAEAREAVLQWMQQQHYGHNALSSDNCKRCKLDYELLQNIDKELKNGSK